MTDRDTELAENSDAGYELWDPEHERYPLSSRSNLTETERARYRQSAKAPPRDFGTERDTDTQKYFSTDVMMAEWSRL